MQKLTDHYQQLLGFPATWKVDDVNLSVSGLKIEVHLSYVGDEVVCPHYSDCGTLYDKARNNGGVILIPCSLRP